MIIKCPNCGLDIYFSGTIGNRTICPNCGAPLSNNETIGVNWF